MVTTGGRDSGKGEREMSGITTIEWVQSLDDSFATGKSWNPTGGCSPVSEGCRNCYAPRSGARCCGPGKRYNGLVKLTPQGPRWTGVVRLFFDELATPLHWRKPCMIFVDSMSDLFHEKVPDAFIRMVFEVMETATWHTFLILTKRAERLAQWYERNPRFHMLPNVWIGVSVEDRRSGVPRIAYLQTVRAAVRFISVEPLCEHLGALDLAGIDWVIVGGESGHRVRPMDLEWARSVMRQCKEKGIPVFVKQLGTVWSKANGLGSGKGNHPEDWPEDLRVREMPSAFSAGGV